MGHDNAGPKGHDEVFEELVPEVVRALAADAVIGQPVDVGAVKLVAVTSCWFASLGGPSGAERPPTGARVDGRTVGFGAAVGAVHPTAVAVVRGDDVAIYSLRGPDLAEQLKEILEAVRRTASDAGPR